MGMYDDIIGKDVAGGGLYDDILNPKESGALDAVKSGLGDIGLKLNAGTTAAIPEQAIGANELARNIAINPAIALAEKVIPDSVKAWRGGIEDKARDAVAERRKSLESELSPEQRASDQKQYFTDAASWENLAKDGITAIPGKVAELASEGQLFGDAWSDWRKPVGATAESLPSSLLMMGPNYIAAKSAGKGAVDAALKSGLSAEAAQAAGVKAAERTAMAVGGLSEGVQGAGANYEQTRRTVMDMPIEKLRESPFFQEQLRLNGGDEAAARAAAAQAAATTSGSGAFWFDALFGAVGDKYIGSAAAGKGTRAGAVLRGTAQETPTEFVQSGGEKFSENLGVQRFADPSQRLMQDVGEEAVAGGISGGLMGAAMGGVMHSPPGLPAGQPPGAAPALPDTGPISRSANVAMQTGAAADAAAVLGVPEQGADGEQQIAPKSLDAIDRVAQIDQAMQGAAPEQAAAMQAERDQITASWPRAVTGSPTSFSTESGARIDGNYALMEAFELTTSHDEALKPNPAYPREMQPRERDRAASEMQISGIAQRLDPARLGESGDAGTGAPIVGADGLVESGNARTIALKRVYQGDQAKAEAYRQYLKDNAARFGLAPEAIDAMNTPVLVRVRNTPVDRAEFARQANASTVAQMSPSEQARADAARIDVLDDLRPDDNGDFIASRDFIRRFVSRLPATEQGGMIDAKGQLSQSGYARIRNAVLAKAYGDSPVLARMVESMDDNLRNIGKALMQAAPEIAKVRQDVSEGALFDADITPDLLTAVEELSAIKDSGRSMADYLAQGDMIGGKESPESRELMQFLADNVRRPRKIAEFVQRYAEALRAAGNPNQGSLIGDAAAPTKRGLINVASEKDNAETQADIAAAGQPSGKQAGTEGNEEAGRPADKKPAGTPGNDGRAPSDETRLSRRPATDESLPQTWEERKKGNYRAPDLEAIVPADVAQRVKVLVEKWKDNLPEAVISAEDRDKAEALLGPVIDAAQKDEPWFDARVKEVSAVGIGYQLGPTKKIGRAAVKLVEEKFNVDEMKDIVRATIVVNSYDDAQSVIDAIAKGMRVIQINNKTNLVIVAPDGAKLKNKGVSPEGYADVTAFVRLPGGGIAEIQVNIPEMLSAKLSAHVLYEGSRVVEDDPERQGEYAELRDGQRDVYQAALDSALARLASATDRKKYASSELQPLDTGAPLSGTSVTASSSSLNQSPVGKQTNSSPPKDDMNLQPAGNLSGTFISTTSNDIVAGNEESAYTKAEENASGEKNEQHGKSGSRRAQGQEPGAVQGTLGDGPVEPVREGDGGRDSAADRGRNDGDDVQAQVAQPAADGAGAKNERIARDGTRGRAGRNAGIPAGNEWVGFPPETGTLGIPRADMPQIKGDSRGALIQFLSARGIENATEDVPAESLRPSQAEFSTKKALNWGEVREGVDRSVLVSSDGYILDGHHQWIAALAAGENVKAIRFNAPIDKLMAAVFEFPSVRRSEGASTGREQARADFKAALAELGALLRQINPGLAMLTPEEKTKLMPTLVRLFEAGIRELGYTMKELVASVKKAMRASDDPFVKKHWNKIDEQTYREAANQAIENVQNGSATGAPGTLDLFEKQNAPRQGNLFDAMEKSAPEVFEQADKAPAGDMADRTDAQLLHLAKHPRSEEKRAAAVAELKRRGLPVPDQLPPESKAPEAPKKRSDGKLGKRAEDARQIMAEGGYWRKQLETQYTGGEKFETRLRYKNGGVVPGFGYKTFAEMQDAGLLTRREVPSSTVWAEEWGLRSTPLEKPAEESGAKPENQDPEKPQKPKREKASRPTPAGRDIPPKTGQNYAFGDDDLTYAGSWFSKAKQNVEAVELVKALEAEGRQATREEQAALAKFIGWGSSEIANSIFGKNLDKSIAKINEYEAAIAAFDDIGSNTIPFRHKHYWTAWSMISGTPGASAQMYGRDITRDMVEKAKPVDMSPKKWGELRDRLKAAMTAEEWAEASRSTQYAHYTSKSVVKAMWGAMERMGFKGGTILEPGAGIGVFPGLMPAGMATNSAYTGIEFDSITGAILKQLFPDERVLVESFVDSKLPAGFFDVAAGNPPFNATKILSDPKYKKHAFALHDYFFAKTIDLVKPGGLVMFVTSRYTMDKLNDKARAYMAERADLVGAIRLPQTAFKKNAGTEVVTDVLFLRKKVDGETFDQAQPWAKAVPLEVNGARYNINEYFAAHPEMVLGTHSDTGSMYGDKEYTVLPRAGDIEAQFVEAANTLPENIYVAERGSAAEAAQVREIDFNPKAQKEGNYYVTDAGVLMQREGGVGQRVDTSPKTAALLKDFVILRDALKQAHYDQLNDSADWEKSLAALQKSYRAFVKKHGRINQFTTYMQKVKVEEMDDDGNPTGNKVDDVEERRRFTIIGKIDEDPDNTLVSALESFNEDTGEITDGAFLTARVLNRPAAPKIDTPADALLSVLNDSGKVDIDEIAARSGVDRSEALLALGPLVYDAPGAGWQTADEYLSGNVKRKLEEAKVAAKSDRRFERNVEALMAAQPAPVPPSDIDVSIGMNWITEETYATFLREKTGVRAKVIRSEHTGQWAVDVEQGWQTKQATQDWGTPRRHAGQILLAALTGAPIRITETQRDAAGGQQTVFLADETEAANQKVVQMRDAFREWIWQDAERADTLTRLYNDKFNTIVPRSFNGSHLTLPGKSEKWSVFDHVKRGAWRIIQNGNSYLAHAVGSGKAQPLDAKVLTPSGWKLMGDIVPGDMVVAADGSPTMVEAVFPQGQKEIFRVEFSDGSSTECCDEHLWLTQTYRERSAAQRAARLGRSWPHSAAKVRSLAEIRKTLVSPHLGAKNHSIPIVGAVQFSARPLPLDAYVLGALLGDGGLSGNSAVLSSADQEILDMVAAKLPDDCEIVHRAQYDYTIAYRGAVRYAAGGGMLPSNPVINALRDLGVFGLRSHEKHIPDLYLFNSTETRVALLQGILDTDGWVEGGGRSLRFTTTSPKLADGVVSVVQSLGGVALRRSRSPSYTHNGVRKIGREAHELTIALPPTIKPFRLRRKAEQFIPRTKYAPVRYVTNVVPVGRKPAQCILVAHKDHLYVTDDFIVTHNTFQMVISAMEQKRLGLIKKPMMVVPNHMLQQFAREWQDLYPAARLMVADEKNFHTENRRRFVSRVAMSNLDGVIITHSAFKLLDLDPEFKQKMIEQELDVMRAAYAEAGGDLDKLMFVETTKKDGSVALKAKSNAKDIKVKQIESRLEKLEQKLRAAMSSEGKDQNVRFDQLGVDMLYVDEAHEFRKLSFTTQRQAKGIAPDGSERAFDLWMKTRWLEEKNPGRSLVMASGTPVTNTLAELYTVQRFMAPEVLEERGLDSFDAWAAMFGREITEIEGDASGKYGPVTRFSKFVNVPELTQMFREFADVLISDNLAALLADSRPTVKDGSRKLVLTPQTVGYAKYKKELAERLKESREWKRSFDEPNNPDPVIKIIGDGRLAAIDMRFINPSAPSDPDSKLNKMIDEIIRVYKETADREFTTGKKSTEVEAIKGATQMVFSDLGFGAGVTENRGFNARAWFEKRLRDAGIPPAHVAFMSDHKKSVAKLKLFKDLNAGRVRILVGSSKNMGTGVNAQQRLAALHHLDTPWYPADLEQREGRIVRNGNKHAYMGIPVELYAYSTKGSYDAVMWQMLSSKQRFIDQALSGDSSVRSIDDLSEASQFALATAMTADDPRAIQLAGIRADVEKLQRLYRAHEETRSRNRAEYEWAGNTIETGERNLPQAIEIAKKVQNLSGDNFTAKAGENVFDSRKEWGAAIMAAYAEYQKGGSSLQTKVGEISGFPVHAMKDSFGARLVITPTRGVVNYVEPALIAADITADPVGVALRAANVIAGFGNLPAKIEQTISDARSKRIALESRLNAPFPMAEILADKLKEAAEVEAAMMRDQNKKTGLEREQELEDAWAERTGAITPLFSRNLAYTENHALPNRSFGNRTIDGSELAALRRAAARIERPQDGVFLRVTEDGRAVATGPKGTRVPDTFRRFAEENDLVFTAGRIVPDYSGTGIPVANMDIGITKKSEPMPIIYRESRALYFGEMGAVDDRTGKSTFSRGNGAGMALRDLQATADRVSRGFKNLPKAHVLASPADLSTKDPAQKALRDFIRKAGAWEDVEGATHQGEIYLFASGLADEARAEHVLATHEVTHYGLRGAAGKGLDAALQHIWMNNADVRKQAAAIKRRNGLASNVQAVEEVLADMRPDQLAKLNGWRRIVKAVRDWLNKAGATKLAAKLDGWMKAGLTEQEKADLFVADLVNAARNFARNGKPNGGVLMDGTRLADGSLAEDVAAQEKWLTAEAKARGYAGIEGMLEKNYPLFEKLAAKWREQHPADALLSRASNAPTAAERADAILSKSAATWRPVDAIMRGLTRATRFDKATGFIYDKAGALIDRYTPEQIKAGVVSDYGVPEAVIDRRIEMQGRQRAQIRKTGALLEKLSTLTRAESRLVYEWMNNNDPQAAAHFEKQLPPESISVMEEIKAMIDSLSHEAIALGQLSLEAYKRNRFEYLRRSYVKYTAELTKGESIARWRAIAILGEQYNGRGMTDAVDMKRVQNSAPEWWGRKLQDGKADKGLVGEKFVRFERRAPTGEGNGALEAAQGPGNTNPQKPGKLLEIAYWPAGEKAPAKYAAWDEAGTWEVRDTKGDKLIVWRDFTKAERVAMGEIDEARYAIAKTLHGMIHDVETGKYLEWVVQTYGKPPGEAIDGEIVEASDRMRDTFAPGTWVQVPDTKVQGTQVAKYGKLAGQFIPGPIWNDVRQTVGFRFKPLGELYGKILSAWKTSKTALSPAVHTNNIMANFVMADWHDVTAGHIAKALRIILGASQRAGKGLIGRTGNAVSRAGMADAEAAREIINRFQESGANMGSWVNAELQKEQLEPLLDALEHELGTAGQHAPGQVGAFAALQLALQLRFPSAWEAAKPTAGVRAVTTEARSLIDLYEAEDQVFRLAAWLKAKEDGESDLVAGRRARKSFLDYHINAPWIQAMRQTALPFISFSYRAIPMALEIAAKKPHKLMKLALFAGLANALGYLLSGGDEDDERKLLPDEKAGNVWGLVPKLIRMPWNDKHGSPVFLDIRRFVPVGDIFDTGMSNAAVPILPMLTIGGPLAVLSEIMANKSQFTGRPITLETDTATEKAAKVADHLYKAFAPNVVILPGTHAFTNVANAGSGRTDSFGREQSVAQAGLSSFGVKVASYPKDVLTLNAMREAQGKMMEIDRQITQVKRERARNGIDEAEFRDDIDALIVKKQGIAADLQKRMTGGR